MSVVKRTFTATKTLSGKPMKFKPWNEYSVGDILIGKYIKTTPNKFNDAKPNHVIEIIETFLKDKKVQKEWVEGTHVCLNTSGMLDKALTDVSIGTLVQITYNGTAMIEKGKFSGKEAHSIMVEEIEEDSSNNEIYDEFGDL